MPCEDTTKSTLRFEINIELCSVPCMKIKKMIVSENGLKWFANRGDRLPGSDVPSSGVIWGVPGPLLTNDKIRFYF